MSAERILVAHPAADLYGSDLQLVEAVRALRAAGAAVRVVLPEAGPLHERLRRAGAGAAALGPLGRGGTQDGPSGGYRGRGQGSSINKNAGG